VRIEIIGDAHLQLGDCLEALPALPNVDAVITDPPYGHGWTGIGKRSTAPPARGGVLWGERRVSPAIIGHDLPFDPVPFLALNVPCLFWGANHYADKLPSSPAWLVWDKREGTTSNYQSDCELAWCNVGGSARLFHHLWNGLSMKSGSDETKRTRGALPRLHPTQKPVALMEWCIQKIGAKAGATILDPYMGSGTTGVACAKMGRKFVGVEIDPKYFEIACRRIDAAHAQGKLRLPDNGSDSQ
jgi:site-specific DNA-methyltransferase (adenine-specific)